MKLYGSYTSPYVRHCRIALAETGLEFEFIETDHAQSAKLSPTRRVPFLHDRDLMLTDSASILKYIREKGGESFFDDVRDYDLFLLVNTALDTTVNLFLLEKDGITPQNSAYLQRQAGRARDTLERLDAIARDELIDHDREAYTDGELRLGCFLSWGLFRERFTLDDFDHLKHFLERIDTHPAFSATHPTNTP